MTISLNRHGALIVALVAFLVVFAGCDSSVQAQILTVISQVADR
ncbi:hypothetical protein SAMN04488550_4588 [Gordonia malaquae]|nr:hypothetical protein [Gordonia malaquae]SEE57825.1 hypothetical protein SAMN04488550_4577 [Gordonia malaquae]SEE58122.1 hypothetical protein SAMN04488550_4588 [Gordonia malaquae]